MRSWLSTRATSACCAAGALRSARRTVGTWWSALKLQLVAEPAGELPQHPGWGLLGEVRSSLSIRYLGWGLLGGSCRMSSGSATCARIRSCIYLTRAGGLYTRSCINARGRAVHPQLHAVRFLKVSMPMTARP